MKERIFDRPLTPQTLKDRTWIGDPAKATDQRLIDSYHYSSFVNYLIRYYSCKHYYWQTNDTILLNQMGGDDWTNKLRAELAKRGLFEEAENCYSINSQAILRWIANHPRPYKPKRR